MFFKAFLCMLDFMEYYFNAFARFNIRFRIKNLFKLDNALYYKITFKI